MLIIYFCLGVFLGYSETYMYRYLNDMGASSLMLGLTVTVGGLLEIALLLVSSSLVRAVGAYPIMAAGFLSFCIKFVG